MSRYLTVNRIEFAVTYLCNSRCGHCQLGNIEERKRFPSHIDKNVAVEIVNKVGSKYNPESIMTFGGEPLLYPEIVYAIHKEATKAGIPVRDVITNGFWARKIGEIQRYLLSQVRLPSSHRHFSRGRHQSTPKSFLDTEGELWQILSAVGQSV